MKTHPEHGPYLRVTVLGVPIYLHWSLPLLGAGIGLLPAMYTPPGRGFTACLWVTAFLVLLVLLHEIGHAVCARAVSARVHGIVLSALGGCCFCEEPVQLGRKLVILLGGIGAQLALLVVSSGLLWLLGAPSSEALTCLVFVFVGVNVVYIAFSAFPSNGSDGERILAAIREGRKSGSGAGRAT